MLTPSIQTLDLPKLDDWLNSNRLPCTQVRAKRTRTWREGTKTLAKAQNITPVENRAYIRAWVTLGPVRRKWDAHNLQPTLKAITDGIVDAGLIADDNNTILTGPDIRAGEPGRPRVRLEIVDLGEYSPDLGYLLATGYTIQELARLIGRTPTAVRHELQTGK